jgi:hypothetical protein
VKAILAAAAVALLPLTGCGSDPRAANNANFQRAIDGKLEKPESRLCVELEALVTAKLAARQAASATLSVSKLNPTTFRMDESTISAPEIVYEAGPEFSKYAVVTPSPFLGSDTKLCFASLQVDRIENFSEPGQVLGATVSSVYYRAKAINVASWVTEPAIRAAFPSINSDLQQATTTQRSAIVVLMSDGWQAQSARASFGEERGFDQSWRNRMTHLGERYRVRDSRSWRWTYANGHRCWPGPRPVVHGPNRQRDRSHGPGLERSRSSPIPEGWMRISLSEKASKVP